jgi:hypothetical protein
MKHPRQFKFQNSDQTLQEVQEDDDVDTVEHVRDHHQKSPKSDDGDDAYDDNEDDFGDFQYAEPNNAHAQAEDEVRHDVLTGDKIRQIASKRFMVISRRFLGRCGWMVPDIKTATHQVEDRSCRYESVAVFDLEDHEREKKLHDRVRDWVGSMMLLLNLRTKSSNLNKDGSALSV